MRGSQIFAGLVIIALLAMGLVYLEGHGYFRDQRIRAMGALKPDANAPKPEPPEADLASLTAANNGNTGMTGNLEANKPATTSTVTPSTVTPSNVTPSPAPPARPTSAAAELAKVVYPTAQINNPEPTVTSTTPQNGNTQQPVTTAKPASTPAATAAAPTPTAAATPVATQQETTRIVYKIVYVDAEGNACRPKRVAVKERAVTTVARVHHYRPRHLVDNSSWIYGTSTPPPPPPPRRAMVASTSCGLLQQTPSGGRVVNLPAGMSINVALDRELSTVDSVAGQEFGGYLIGPITYCGEVIVPAGATVEGTVSRARRRAALSDDEAVLQLRLSGMDANGMSVPLAATSSSRRNAGEIPYRTVDYMNNPNYIETTRDSTRDVTLPAQSVVSFSLRATTAVSF